MNINNVWAEILIEEMYRHGITHFFIAPGSRSAPLTLACASNPRIKTRIHFDERGLCYFALGYVKASKTPAAIITTSGTAVANLLPAVAEAFLTHIPLILLTADRPQELIDCGANQAIRQPEIFKDFTTFHCSLAEPDDGINPKYVQETATKIIRKALSAGLPVHLNCPFAEPLYPNQGSEPSDEIISYLNSYRNSSEPAVKETAITRYSSPDLSAAETERFQNPGIIMAGSLDSREKAEAVIKIAEFLNWPIYPDPQSQLRQSDHAVIYADLLLDSEDFFEKSAKSETVLIVGSHFISKNFSRLLKAMNNAWKILLTDYDDIPDPVYAASLLIHMPVVEFADYIINNFSSSEKSHNTFVPSVSALNWLAESKIYIDPDQFSEPAIVRYISQNLPGSIFLGNSLPARIFSKFAKQNSRLPMVYSNRGASGIDGITATACGIADCEKETVTLLTGDLSALHDLNSLALAADKNICIVVINNAGGNIFSVLPGARDSGYTEKFFALKHSYGFRQAAEMFNLDYRCVTSMEQLRDNYPPLVKTGILLECVIPWNQTPELLEKIRKETAKLKISEYSF